MRIIFNTDQIYLHGGIEKVMATKANYFAALPGYDVIILTTEQREKPPCYFLDERILRIDLKVNYDRSKSYVSGANIQKIFKHFLRQRKQIKKLQPDFIISANYNFDHYWLPLFKSQRVKIIKEIHASGYATAGASTETSMLSKIFQNFNKKILSSYDTIVVLNDDEKKYQTTNNIEVIPNPITIPKEQAALDNKWVIAAGRIAPVKGFDQLVEAWQLVHRQKPEWQLHIYGDAYSDTKYLLQKQIKSSNLEDVIFFKDSVENLPTAMVNYSIYAMSSVTECFPMVLLEALSVGLPIVTYDCPNGPRHIVQHTTDGLIVKNQNSHELALGLLKLMENDGLRKKMGFNAKINSANFATQTTMTKWLQLFEKLKPKQE